VEIANGATIAQVCRTIGGTDQTYYRWRGEYGGMRVDQAKRLKELEAEQEAGGGSGAGYLDPERGRVGRLLSPAKRRAAVAHVRQVLGHQVVSERRACTVLDQARSTQRRERVEAGDEARLRASVVALAEDYGRYGYRRITALLHDEGWRVNHERVERIWREEGLKVPQKQPKRRRLWLNDGSCVRLRPQYPGHVWSYDFVEDRTHDGRKLRMLTIIDEFTRECLSIDVDRRLSSDRVLARLTELFAQRGAPD